MKYGDAVTFLQKQGDDSVRRVNAIVLASNLHVPTTADRKQITDADGVPVEHEEHLDLAFPVLSLAPGGQVLKTRNLEEIFRPAYDVPPFREGAWIGYEVPAEAQGSGSERYADWTTMGQDKDGFPVAKGSPTDVTTVDQSEYIAQLKVEIANLEKLKAEADDLVTAQQDKIKEQEAKIEELTPKEALPDTHAEEIADAENNHGQ